MSTYDLLYMWHSVEQVARDIWNLSPTFMVIIGAVLCSVVYFTFKR